MPTIKVCSFYHAPPLGEFIQPTSLGFYVCVSLGGDGDPNRSYGAHSLTSFMVFQFEGALGERRRHRYLFKEQEVPMIQAIPLSESLFAKSLTRSLCLIHVFTLFSFFFLWGGLFFAGRHGCSRSLASVDGRHLRRDVLLELDRAAPPARPPP